MQRALCEDEGAPYSQRTTRRADAHGCKPHMYIRDMLTVAAQKYVDDDEITKGEFVNTFTEALGGTWDYDGEHGGDLSVKISRTVAA